MSASAKPASANALGFSLSFAEGRGLLGLRERKLLDLVTLERLELEIPNLRFPFDVTGGAARFQHRRLRVREALLAIDEAQARVWLGAREAPGLEQLSLRFGDGAAVVRGRVGGREFLSRLRLEAAGGPSVAVVVRDVRIFGFAKIAAPQVGLALLTLLGGEIAGATDLVLDPLREVLWRMLPPVGWRMPQSAAGVLRAQVRAGRVEIEYAPGEMVAPAPDDGRAAFREADALITAGDLEAARAAYRQALESGADHPFVLTRLCELGCAQEATLDETETLAHEILRKRPSFAPALLALAQIADARGESQEMAERLERLASMDELGGDQDAARAALAAAARAHDSERATALWERVLAIEPGDDAAAAALCARYRAENRWEEVSQLLARRLAAAQAPADQARLCAELGQVVLDTQGDSVRAIELLERAVRTEDRADTWTHLARALAIGGDLQRALTTAEHAIKLGGGEAPAQLVAANVLEQLGDEDGALLRLRRVVELEPRHFFGWWQLGKIAERRGAFDEAARAYTRWVEIEDGNARVQPLEAVARMLDRLGDPAGAKARLEEALALGGNAQVLAHLARLCERDDAARAMELYERAAALGDVQARAHVAARDAAAAVGLEQKIDRLAVLTQACRDAGDRPGEARARAERGRALLEAGRAEEATNELVEATALGHPEWQALGEALFAREDWKQSYWALAQVATPGLDVRRKLAECCDRLGRGREAFAHWQALLAGGAQGALAQLSWKRIVGHHTERGDHAGAAAALAQSAEDPATGEGPRERAVRFAGAGEIARKRIGDPEQARKWYERALALDPYLVAVLDALEGIVTTDGDLARLAELLEHKVAALARRPGEQRSVLVRLGEVLLQAGRKDEARAAHERACAIDPDCRPSLAFLARDDLARGDRQTSRTRYLRLLSAPDATPADRLESHLALGRLARELGHDRDAERHLRGALELDPASEDALEGLEEIYAAEGRDADLADVLAHRLAIERRPDRLLDLGLRRAALLADRLGRRRDAIAALRQVLALHPWHGGALVKLAALGREEGAHADLAVALERLAEMVETAPPATELGLPQAAMLHVEAAEVLAERLSDPARAEAHLSRALERDPRCLPALEGLERLARARGDDDAVDALLGRRAAIEDDAERRAAITIVRARARTERGRADAARELLASLGDDAPDEALALRARLEADSGEAAAAAAAWTELAARARGAGDAKAEAAALAPLARLLEGPLERLADAERIRLRLCEIAPADVAAAEALVRLCAHKDAGGRALALEKLRDALRKSFAPPAREIEVLQALADTLGQAERHDEAVARLREALALLPGDAKLAAALAQAAMRAGQTALAAHAWEDVALADPTPEAWLALANAAETLGDRARLRRALEQAAGAGADVLDRLARVLFELGEYAQAAAQWAALGDRATPEDIARLAECHERTGHLDEAAVTWRRLSTPEARKRLSMLLRAAGKPAELARTLEQLAQDAPSPAERAITLREAGALYLAAGESERAASCAHAAQQIDPGEAESLRILAQTLSPSELAALASQLSVSAPPPGRVALHLAVADAAGETDLGAEALKRAAAAEPDPARAASLRVREAELRAALAEGAGRLDAAEAALARITHDHPDPRALLLRLTDLATRRGDALAQAAWLEQRLAANPDDEEALATLYRLRPSRELGLRLAERVRDPAESARLYAELAASARDPAAEADALTRLHPLLAPAERGPISVRLARLCIQLGNPGRARLVAWRASEELEAPHSAEALQLVARLADEAGDAEETLEALSALRASGQAQPSELARLAELARDHGNPAERIATLEVLAQTSPRPELLVELGDHYAVGGQTEKAIDFYGLALSLPGTDRDERARLRTRIGELHVQAGDHSAARAAFEAVLREHPDFAPAQLALERLTPREGELAARMEAEALAPTGESRKLVEMGRKAAEDAERKGQLDEAARLYRAAADLDPGDRTLAAALERVHRARGDAEGVSEALGRQILAVSDRGERAALWHRRALLYHERGAENETYRCLKEALSHAPDLIDAGRLARQLAERRGDWAFAAEQLYREIEAAFSPEEAARLHVELARMFEERLADGEQALRNYEQAHLVHPDDIPILQALARLHAAAGRFLEAATFAGKAAARLPASSRAPVLLAAADYAMRAGDAGGARLHLVDAARVGPPEIAEAVLARLVQLEPRPPEELHAERESLAARLAAEQAPAVAAAFERRLLELALQLGDTNDSDTRARALLERAPADPLAFAVRRRTLARRGDLFGQLELYRTRAAAVDEPEERAGLLVEIAQLAERLHDAEAAAASLDEALAIAPGHPLALPARAELAFRAQDWETASTLYARMVELHPEQAGAIALRRGELAEILGREEEAEELLRKAVAAAPRAPAPREALSRVLLARGRLPQALEELRTVANLLPPIAVDKLTEVRLQIGEVAARLARPEEARIAIEPLLHHEAARTPAIELLAGIYAQLGRWEQAADMQGRLSRLQDTPDLRAERLYRQGEIYRLQLGDTERAGECYLRASDLDPTHIPTLWRLVEYFFAQLDWEQLLGVERDLRTAGARADDVLAPPAHSIMSGIALALRGDGTAAKAALVEAPAADLAAHAAFAIRHARAAEADQVLDAAPDAAALETALDAQVEIDPADAGAHLLLFRLRQRSDDPRAPAHRDVLSFLALRLSSRPADDAERSFLGARDQALFAEGHAENCALGPADLAEKLGIPVEEADAWQRIARLGAGRAALLKTGDLYGALRALARAELQGENQGLTSPDLLRLPMVADLVRCALEQPH
jgi:tetratricopeptide (TPR) repeat protein